MDDKEIMMMLNIDLHHAAEPFIAAVRGLEEYNAYVKAETAFQSDPGLREIRKHFNERSTELQTKQATGTLTQEEIAELRGVQTSLNAHPVTTEYIHARQKIVATLQECNRGLSQELGFDFASAAAPPSCCG